MRTKLDRDTTLLILAHNNGCIEDTARQTGVSHVTIRKWKREAEEEAASLNLDETLASLATLQPSELSDTQTQHQLTASDEARIQQKLARIAVWDAVQMLYATKLLTMDRDRMSPQQVATIAGIASDKTQNWEEGRGKPVQVTVDNRTQIMGTDAARAAASSYQRRRRKRS